MCYASFALLVPLFSSPDQKARSPKMCYANNKFSYCLKPEHHLQAVVVPDRQQGAAAWQIRTRYQRVAWAVRALTGFAAASREEDRFGVLQLTEPRLGAVVQVWSSVIY